MSLALPPPTGGCSFNFAEPPSSLPLACLGQSSRCSFYGVFSSPPPASSSPVPTAQALSTVSQYPPPPPPRRHLPVDHVPRPAAKIKRRKVVARGVRRARGPPGIFSQWVVLYGLQQPWDTRSHLGRAPNPAPLPAQPCGDGLHWPHCWVLWSSGWGQPLPGGFRP